MAYERQEWERHPQHENQGYLLVGRLDAVRAETRAFLAGEGLLDDRLREEKRMVAAGGLEPPTSGL